MQLVVGRIGRAHGIRGDVFVAVRTDDPEARFAAGSVLATDPAEVGPLTVTEARNHSGKLVVSFAGYTDRSAAETLSGVRLVIDSADLPPSDDPEEFHDHELVGLAAVLGDGTPLGSVTEVVHGPAGDLLAIAREGGGEVLVPFILEFVPEVDVAGGRVVLTPPEGLLDL
ncbi:MAG TPA: ribosome maturation factor RimM [Mycobacteriales bacterium]|nr:rRNA processing protein RimM [Cryptosporangiaceae bacterium]MDQ1678841.1 rRNA processing protein RimM [Actinomycetota bacterium]HEV7756185.1 ribosome maturation factor RimM [Mycobacteriales bacterium]